jgi:hypothetical protein
MSTGMLPPGQALAESRFVGVLSYVGQPRGGCYPCGNRRQSSEVEDARTRTRPLCRHVVHPGALGRDRPCRAHACGQGAARSALLDPPARR